MEPLLSIRKLTKRFGGLTAVREMSWDVYRGEVVALLGDNGAGKSTVIKCISGVYHADEGEIFFEGRPARFAMSTISAMLPFEQGAMMNFFLSRVSPSTASGHGSRRCQARLR